MPPFVFDFHASGSRLFLFRLRFSAYYIHLSEFMTPPPDEQFAVLTSLLFLRRALEMPCMFASGPGQLGEDQ